MGKYKMRFNLSYDNVQGKSKGESAFSKDIEFDGSSSVNLFFSSPLPGEYKVDATLLDESGKEIGKKSGTITLKGSAPAASTDTKKDADADSEADDKSHDKQSKFISSLFFKFRYNSMKFDF